MKITLRFLLTTTLLCGANATAEDIGGPSLGHIASGNSLRPIRGVPGAATWGDVVDAGEGVSAIAVSPRGSYAILSSDAGVRVATFGPQETLAISDPGLPADFRPSITAFSPSGANAALYDAGSGALWLLQGGAASAVDLSMTPGPPAALAVSEGAAPLIAGVPGADAHSVFVLDGKGGYRLISGLGGVAAISFVGSTRDLAIADRAAKRLSLLRNPLTGTAPEQAPDVALYPRPVPRPAMAGRDSGERTSAAGSRIVRLPVMPAGSADGPLAVVSSADGALLAVATGKSDVALYRVATGQWTGFHCDCDAAALAPLRGNAVFRLGGAAGETLWILDADSEEPRLAFVPAAQREEQQ
jgi:hypothetical protein